jgi:hypothetical protein
VSRFGNEDCKPPTPAPAVTPMPPSMPAEPTPHEKSPL